MLIIYHICFLNVHLLKSLPDISKWNISNANDMEGLFSECIYLQYLPDLSKWNTENVNDISGIFYKCYSLKYLSDISV